MKMMKNWQVKIILIVFLTVTLLFALSKKDYYKKLSDSLILYEKVYQTLVSDYVNQIDVEEFTEKSINSALKKLDPYTVFLTEDEKEPIERLSTGNYGGVGIRITLRNDTLTAIAPMEGGPAKRAGILPGDQIIKVDTIFTSSLTLDEASKKLRGDPGIKVILTILRPGLKDEFEVHIIREKIDVPVISYSGMIDSKTGYIKLAGFSRGATEEVKKILKEFEKNENFSNFILDLRGNPGGLLQEAIGIAELFTEKGDTLLFTKGRMRGSNSVFISQQKPLIDEKVNIAALIDRGSASASEIVAGILQDTDRGIIVGTKSYGKGLVQRVKPIDKDHSLKITNAKYYIPSGRCIQKPDFIQDTSLVDLTFVEDSLYFSKNGRELKGGGGVRPDVEIEEPKLSVYVQKLWASSQFYNFAIRYKADNGIPDYPGLSEEIIEEFRQFLISKNFNFEFKEEKEIKKIQKALLEDEKMKDLAPDLDDILKKYHDLKYKQFDENIPEIRQGLISEFSTLDGGLEKRIEISLNDDIVLQKAIATFQDQNEYLNTLGYKY
ncbi:MAG: PDZ domain-containing protein [Candidatus Marinimicrobia bacterium]|nr:PDZ domain-containing protein [Candidatus Neomarinimicrobiota bacterium]